MNNYEIAIKENKTTDFLLGRNEFFIRNRDFGDHDIASTYFDFLNFALENGEIRAFERLDKDLQKVLDDDNLTHSDLVNVIGYIHFYYSYRFVENKFLQDWSISTELQNKIARKIDQIGVTDNLQRVLSILKNKYQFRLT